MTSIREEIRRIEGGERGELTAENKPLKNAPHTQSDVISKEWDRPYSRDEKFSRRHISRRTSSGRQ